jgi:hypothetical protein
VGTELFHAADMMKQMVALHNFTNAPRKIIPHGYYITCKMIAKV